MNDKTVSTDTIISELRTIVSWLLNSRIVGHEARAVHSADVIKRAVDALARTSPVEPGDWQVEAALEARVPGGSQVWHWIDGGGMGITETHRSVMRTILSASSIPTQPEGVRVVEDRVDGWDSALTPASTNGGEADA